jgi:hypothetical protein
MRLRSIDARTAPACRVEAGIMLAITRVNKARTDQATIFVPLSLT